MPGSLGISRTNTKKNSATDIQSSKNTNPVENNEDAKEKEEGDPVSVDNYSFNDVFDDNLFIGEVDDEVVEPASQKNRNIPQKINNKRTVDTDEDDNNGDEEVWPRKKRAKKKCVNNISQPSNRKNMLIITIKNWV